MPDPEPCPAACSAPRTHQIREGLSTLAKLTKALHLMWIQPLS